MAILFEVSLKDFEKAEQFYLKAVEKEHAGAMNNLAWNYFTRRLKKDQALRYAQQAVSLRPDDMPAIHTLSCIQLWRDQVSAALQSAGTFLDDQEYVEKADEDVLMFFLLLLAKERYAEMESLFLEQYPHFQDQFKPIYYALMHYRREQHPNEFLRMGDELKETVEEIIQKVEEMREAYA